MKSPRASKANIRRGVRAKMSPRKNAYTLSDASHSGASNFFGRAPATYTVSSLLMSTASAYCMYREGEGAIYIS